MVHGWTCYVKLRPSKSRSMAGILKTEGLSHDLIVTVLYSMVGGSPVKKNSGTPSACGGAMVGCRSFAPARHTT
jgi:hypothetical protein